MKFVDILNKDIQSIIVSYIDNKKDLLSWRHICKYTFIKHDAAFICTRSYNIFNTPKIDVSKRRRNIIYTFQIKYIKCGIYTKESVFINQSEVETLVCSYVNNFSDRILLKLPKLTTLYCYHNNTFTDLGLSTLTNLTNLNCGCNTNFTDESIKKLTNLKYLNIGSSTNITDESIKHLTKLEYLVPNGNITMDSLQYLTNLTELHDSFNTIDMILQCKKLRVLSCKNLVLHDEHISHLVDLKILNNGPNTYFTDNSISKLTKLRSLEIYAKYENITDSSIQNLVNLNELAIINLLNYPISITDHSLSKLVNLKLLYLYGHNSFTDNSLKCLTELTHLCCGGNTLFTNKGLSKLSKLKWLDCGSNINFNNKGIEKLYYLHFVNCRSNNNFKFKYVNVHHFRYTSDLDIPDDQSNSILYNLSEFKKKTINSIKNMILKIF